MSIRVMIADNHEVVRRGLAEIFQNPAMQIISEAVTGEEAIEQALKHKPDILILEVRLPVIDGLTALEKIKQATPEVKAILFSAEDNPTHLARAAALGASDYVLKSSPCQELFTAVNRIAAGEQAGADSLLSRMRINMTRRLEPADQDLPVTNRELQVLRHVALGLSNREIGLSLAISIETVKEHVQNLFRKLAVADRTQAAVWAVKRGLV